MKKMRISKIMTRRMKVTTTRTWRRKKKTRRISKMMTNRSRVRVSCNSTLGISNGAEVTEPRPHL
jgi:hypothetical protein